MYLLVGFLLVVDDTPPTKVLLVMLYFDESTWLQERHTEHRLDYILLHLLFQFVNLLAQFVVVSDGVFILNHNGVSFSLQIFNLYPAKQHKTLTVL